MRPPHHAAYARFVRRRDLSIPAPVSEAGGNLEAHGLHIKEENGDLRVRASGQSYLMKGLNREAFLKQYHEALDRARLNFAALVTDAETLEFTPAEQISLKQRIVLYWLYVYNLNDRWFKFLWWSMGASETRWEVWRAAEGKYGGKSERATALAAHTLNMPTKKFRAWLKRYEEFVNR